MAEPPEDPVERMRMSYVLGTEGRWEEFLEWCALDIVWTERMIGIDSATYEGREGVRRWIETTPAMSEQIAFRPVRYVIDGDRGAAEIRVCGRMAGGFDYELTVGHAARWHDGLLAALTTYSSFEEAAADVGLDPSAASELPSSTV